MSSHFDFAPSRRSRDHRKSRGSSQRTGGGGGAVIHPFLLPQRSDRSDHQIRRRRSFINIVDRRRSAHERWMSVLSLLFIIDSFCRSDLVSRQLAPFCQSAGWCARERPHVHAHWDWCRRMKADEAASRTMGTIPIPPLGLLCYWKSLDSDGIEPLRWSEILRSDSDSIWIDGENKPTPKDPN